MAYSVFELSSDLPFGRIIRGLHQRDIEDAKVREELKDLWIKQGLLVFKDTDIDDTFQINLSRVFGPLGSHPVREVQSTLDPNLIRISSLPDDSTLVDIDGEIGGAWLGWHSDLVYHHEINHGGMLRGLQLTSRGGRTGFIDQIDAYNRLPDILKKRIDGLNVVYQLGMIDQFPNAYPGRVKVVRLAEHSAKIMARVEADFPPVVHPLVFIQPETGRKVLNLSPMFARCIEGMHDAEGDSLLAELSEHFLNSPQYHHEWTLDDMLLWDNWRMLHSISLAPADEPRIMQRTTILGDYGLGRKAAGDAARGVSMR